MATVPLVQPEYYLAGSTRYLSRLYIPYPDACETAIGIDPVAVSHQVYAHARRRVD
jgi:hypothetical protein